MITESQIKSAIKNTTTERRRIELRDEGERCGGRLVLVVRSLRTSVTCEWYALYHRDSKRRLTKMGTYPALTLGQARARFREEYTPAILAGVQPQNCFARAQHRKHRSDISVLGLFAAYVKHLKEAGQGAWYQAERILIKRADSASNGLGPDRPAARIEPETIVAHLAAIHARGVVGMAHNTRAYISAAYSFGMKSEHNYTRQEVKGRWGIKTNPVTAIPTDPMALRVGERFLTVLEFRTFWEWLSANYQRSTMAPAVHLIMATGQRVQEILRITEAHFDRAEGLIYWDTTKNGLPHSLPLPKVALQILEGLAANPMGLYFPHRLDPSRHALYTGPNKLCEIYVTETSAPPFTPRDLRRTWKTLAGRAGVSKEMRDRLQNHLQTKDVSARHYDRYDYLAERRAAMEQWELFFNRILTGGIES